MKNIQGVAFAFPVENFLRLVETGKITSEDAEPYTHEEIEELKQMGYNFHEYNTQINLFDVINYPNGEVGY
ncbi:hypothetical protein P8917_10045 [Bacillus atrophaeus]|uniref:hypothetical protein n=1 Tax=Bacillus atrophaeus TaxID=1452 RepID=UPI002280644C|nr:hypothetical protein [Bacillus atrophaeus]MCY8497784.1 hypothetical protein [Bacillus atrophaeus]MCY8814911.1 hypothetical protein [Bacillus atrophaeus]MCY8821543.1 hypothetical protein [Bacillus atrophaeus]MCY8830973.1 hypothetical protein [Bacillus atrophaeus]MCY8835232.1 hypothetical protein [Bacillus atrophaeus]